MLFLPMLFSLAAAPQAIARPEPVRVVLVPHAEASFARLSALGLDVGCTGRGEAGVEVFATDDDLRRLRAEGIGWEVLIEDYQAWFAATRDFAPPAEGAQGSWLTPPFSQGAIGGFYDYDEINSVLSQIHAAYPAITTAPAAIGTTHEVRPILAMKVSDNPGVDESEPEVRIDAMHHAREPMSMQTSLWFLLYLVEGYGTDPLATYLVDERELWFVPIVNPDGYVYNQVNSPGGGGLWRKNRRNNGDGTFGVDMNRNYPFNWGWDNVGSSPSTSSTTYRGPSPSSEPEVQAMLAFISGRDFRTAISAHSYSAVWIYSWGYAPVLTPDEPRFAEISGLATEVNGYLAGPAAIALYEANGVTNDYDYGVHGTLSWTPEIGDSSDNFWPPQSRIVSLAQENLLGFQRTALAAGAFLHVPSLAVAELGDGDGFFEAGESVEITLVVRNSGLDATAGGATATLSSSSPHAAVAAGFHDFGSVGAFAQADNVAAPLRLDLAPGTPSGTSVDFSVTLTYEGFPQVFDRNVPIGQPIALVADELDLDLGWIAGVPGDDATSGLWTRGVPIGTSTGGQQANPGADATPGAGGACFVTGNAGGAAGSDDVDNGATTLITPPIDLSGVAAPTISYARWFADLTVADDVFRVSISDDDGQTWAPLEDVTGNQNQWTTVDFAVADHVQPTAHVRLRFVAEDSPNNSLLEAAVDSLTVTIFDEAPRLSVYGQPVPGAPVVFNVTGPAGATYYLFATPEPPSSGPAPAGVASVARPGAHAQGARLTPISGVVPAERVARLQSTVPTDPILSGTTLHYQALVVSGGQPQPTNWVSVDIP